MQELKKKEEELEMSMRGDVESGMNGGDEQTAKWMRDIQSGVLLQAFTMTFLAEWGDRSQITTVVLAAREVHLCMDHVFMLPLHDLTSWKQGLSYIAFYNCLWPPCYCKKRALLFLCI
jgi:hypothetical protein